MEGLIVKLKKKILSQASNPKTSRHFAEAFGIPFIAGIAGVVGSAAVFNHAQETGDPIAWAYTMSHLFPGPKLSISSITRLTLLSSSVLIDHIQDREIGSRDRLSKELGAIATSGVSWMGAGVLGPGARMSIHAPDLGPYIIKRLTQKTTPTKTKVDSVEARYMRSYGFVSLPVQY